MLLMKKLSMVRRSTSAIELAAKKPVKSSTISLLTSTSNKLEVIWVVVFLLKCFIAFRDIK